MRVALDPKLFGDWWAPAGWTVNPDVDMVVHTTGHEPPARTGPGR
ncbi:hypothetical protein ACWGKU_14025 [Kitasatospora sp. NPDC054768]